MDPKHQKFALKNEEFCKHLPKIELHAHLNGSLSAATLKKMGCMNEVILEYEKQINILKASTSSSRLQDCFQLFKIPHNMTMTENSVYQATKYTIQEFHNDNVIYLELRTTPRDEQNMTKSQYIEAVVRGIQDCDCDIITKLLLSIDRSSDMRNMKDTMELILTMKQKYPEIIKGVDFSGNPFKGTFPTHLFKTAIENGLCTSLHCAEKCYNDDEIKDIFSIRPNRIGHATNLHPKYGGCDKMWEHYCTLNIPLECCLTSNVLCGTAKSYKEHHLKEWIREGLPFILCTDDKAIFDTTLSQELFLAMENFNLNQNDIWQMTYAAVDFSFASKTEKESLKEKLQDWKNKSV